jgi:hypothetical protein
MEKHPICISRTVKFSERLIGVKCPNLKVKPDKGFPYYAINKKKINIEYIRDKGICEVGIFNVLRRFNKLPIPGSGRIDFYPEGSMASWIYVFSKKIKKFNSLKKYPKGTLLLGYSKIAMYLGQGQILHGCEVNEEVLKGKLIDYDFILVCYPKNWILTE